ncbi:MAG TPA: histidinol-phosphate transaminase [bacterium]|nr:histidinol-phosphate transaminase [bacterium]
MSFERFLRPGVATAQPYAVTDMAGGALRLKDNESPLTLSAAQQQALLAPLAGLEFNRYPDSLRQLREKLAARHDWPLDGIVLGNGSDELILLLMLTFGRGPVVVHRPTFVMYEQTARVLDRPVTVLDLEPETWELPAATTDAAATAALVFLASPNSPTGNVYARDRIEAVLRHAAGIVVLDEAYADYAGITYRDLLGRYPHAAILRTFSKVGLAGLRLGYLLAQPTVIKYLLRVKLPYNVNAAVAAMGCAYLDTVSISDLVAPVVAARATLARGLQALGWTVYPSQANLLFCRVAGARAIAARLRAQNIWVRDFDGAFADCLRITVGTTADNARLLAALPGGTG